MTDAIIGENTPTDRALADIVAIRTPVSTLKLSKASRQSLAWSLYLFAIIFLTIASATILWGGRDGL